MKRRSSVITSWEAFALFILIMIGISWPISYIETRALSHSDNEPGFDDVSALTEEFDELEFEKIEELERVSSVRIGANGKYSMDELENWERPAGRARVGIQAGHWKSDEAPEELASLRRSTGAQSGKATEREAMLKIAELVADILREAGIDSEILPTTVPPGYVADAFVSLHADGNDSSRPNGYKIASPYFDAAGTSGALAEALEESYGKATRLRKDKNVTMRMRAYYAFNWQRYEHAVHPKTPSAIVETGFITNARDRAIITRNPNIAAEGIAAGIIAYLESQGLR